MSFIILPVVLIVFIIRGHHARSLELPIHAVVALQRVEHHHLAPVLRVKDREVVQNAYGLLVVRAVLKELVVLVLAMYRKVWVLSHFFSAPLWPLIALSCEQENGIIVSILSVKMRSSHLSVIVYAWASAQYISSRGGKRRPLEEHTPEPMSTSAFLLPSDVDVALDATDGLRESGGAEAFDRPPARSESLPRTSNSSGNDIAKGSGLALLL